MADLKKTIQIIFGAVDNTAGGFQSVGLGLQSVAGSVESATAPIANLTGSLVKMELALIAAGAAMIGVSYNAAVKYQSAALDLQKVLADGEGEVADYSDSIKELGNNYALSSIDVIDATANFKQSGFTISESLNLADIALKAVNIAEMDVNESSRLLTATLKGFGVEADQAGRLLDIWNEVSNVSGANARELALGMADLSPVAKQAGLSFEETAGLLTPVIEIFGSGSEAARALKAVLLRLADDSGPVVDALAALGLSQKTANGEFKSSSILLKELAAIWPKLTSEQRLYYAANIAGIDQAARFSAVVDNYNRVLDITTISLGAAGSAQKEFEVRSASAEFAINKLQNSFFALATSIGSKFINEMTGVVKATTAITNAFEEATDSGALKPLFDALRPALIELEKWLLAVAKALPAALEAVDWTPLIESTIDFSEELKGLFGSLDLTKPEDLAKVINFVIESMGTLTRTVSGIVAGFEPFINQLIEIVDYYNNVSEETKKAGGAFLGFATGVNKVAAALGELGNVLNIVGTGLGVFLGGKGLLAITKAVAPAVASFSKFAGVLAGAGPAGVVGAVGLAGGALTGLLINEGFKKINDDTIGTAIYNVVQAFQKWTTGTNDETEALGKMSFTVEELVPKVDEITQWARDYWDTGRKAALTTGDINAELAALGYTIGKSRNGFISLTNDTDKFGLSIGETKKTLNAFYDPLQDIYNAAEQMAGGMNDAGQMTEFLDSVLNELDYDIPKEGIKELKDSLYALKDTGTITADELVSGLALIEEKTRGAGAWFDELTGSLTSTKKQGDYLVKTLTDAAGNIKILWEKTKEAKDGQDKFAPALADTAKSAEELAKEASLSADKVKELYLDLQKLASDERLKSLEIKATVDVAKIQADTQKFTSALDNISASIESTTSLLSNLFGIWGSASNWDKLQIEDWIDDQLEIQKDQVESQIELNESLIKMYDAQADRLSSGDPYIRIEADPSMEQDLQNIMWTILEKVRVRVSENYGEFLLGCTGVSG